MDSTPSWIRQYLQSTLGCTENWKDHEQNKISFHHVNDSKGWSLTDEDEDTQSLKTYLAY